MLQYRKQILASLILLYGISSTNPVRATSALLTVPEMAKLYAYTTIGFLVGYYTIEQEIKLNTKPVNAYIEQFIRTECKKIGLPDWQTIRIVEHPERYRSFSTINTLCLEKYLVDQITQNGDQTGMARAIIHHEAGHIKHRHIFAKAALNPFLGIASSYSALTLLNHIYPHKESFYTMLALHLGLYFYIITPFFSRICEWDADASIANEPRILAGGIHYFYMLKQHEIAFFIDLEKKFPLAGPIDRWSHDCELISTHPSTEKRIKRLQQRLDNHPNKHQLSQEELAYLLDLQLVSNTKYA